MAVDCGRLQLGNALLRVERRSDAPGQLAPVIEDSWDVLDAVGPLRGAQHQLVVLDSVERGVDAADALDERASQDE